MQIIKNKKPSTIILFIISLLIVFFYFTVAYTKLFTLMGREAWVERLLIPFYFTTISNVLILVLFSCKMFFSKNLFNNKFFKIFEIIAINNITLTIIVYWLLLAKMSLPQLIEERRILMIINTFLVHLVMPLVAIINFLYEIFYLKNKTKIKGDIFINSFKTLLFPISYLVIALIFYFSLGAHKTSAIYFFIDIIRFPWFKTLIYFLSINGFYYICSFLFIYLNNNFSK